MGFPWGISTAGASHAEAPGASAPHTQFLTSARPDTAQEVEAPGAWEKRGRENPLHPSPPAAMSSYSNPYYQAHESKQEQEPLTSLPQRVAPPPVQPNQAGKAQQKTHPILLLPILEVLTAVALVVVVATQLEERGTLVLPAPGSTSPAGSPAYNGSDTSAMTVHYSTCFATTSDINLCLFSYWGAAASIACSLVLLVLQCTTARGARMCRLSLEPLLALLGLIWWGAAAGTLMGYGLDANGSGLERQGWRDAAWVLAWGLCGLFGIHFLAAVMGACCARGRRSGAAPLV